ncbi:M23 family peptidase, partial [Streptomyces sp. JAC25]
PYGTAEFTSLACSGANDLGAHDRHASPGTHGHVGPDEVETAGTYPDVYDEVSQTGAEPEPAMPDVVAVAAEAVAVGV